MTLSQAKQLTPKITPCMVVLLAQQAFHDVMSQQLPKVDEPGTFCIGDDEDLAFQAQQIAAQFEAVLYRELGLREADAPGALPSMPVSEWPRDK